MPTITTPLTLATAIPALKKSKRWSMLASEEAELALLTKRVQARRAELKLELYDLLDGALPEDTKSVQYDYTYTDEDTGEEHTTSFQFTKLAGGTESKTFKKERLLTIPIPCPRKGCKGIAHVDTDMLESCVEYGQPSKPTVSVTEIKQKAGGK